MVYGEELALRLLMMLEVILGFCFLIICDGVRKWIMSR